jgi:hypothetical protein
MGMQNKISAILVALVVTSTGCGTIVNEMVLRHPKVEGFLDTPTVDRTIRHTGHITTIGEGEDSISVLHVYGSPYEMGYQHGKLFAPEVRATIDGVMGGLKRFLPRQLRNTPFITNADREHIVNGLLDRAWAKLEPFTPREDLEEMMGLADGSGIPLEVIHRMHAVPEVTETSCSALFARGTATADGHTYQLRILDYGAEFKLHERPLITIYHPVNGTAYANIGWIGFIGSVSGVNQQGVALSEIGFKDPPGETLHGIPMPFLMKQVLRHAGSADEAAAIVRAAPRTNSYIYFFGDKHGHGIGMITSREQTVAYRPSEQATIEIDGKSLPQFTDVLYAGHYEDRQGELVRKLAGQLDQTTIRDMSCQIAMKSNLHTVIYDLTSATIWVANRTGKDRAADRTYVPFALNPAWNFKPGN